MSAPALPTAPGDRSARNPATVPDSVAAQRLAPFDAAKAHGFRVRTYRAWPRRADRGYPGNAEWRDVIHIGGFSSGCYAWRERRTSLIVPGGSLATIRTEGSALDVLNEVLGWPELPT